jgi:hypothetical protein
MIINNHVLKEIGEAAMGAGARSALFDVLMSLKIRVREVCGRVVLPKQSPLVLLSIRIDIPCNCTVV